MHRINQRPAVALSISILFCIIFFAFIFSRSASSVAGLITWSGFAPEKIFIVGEWYRFITSIIIHENSIFLAISILFLLSLGGPFENRHGSQLFLRIFLGSTAVSFVMFSAMSWGDGLVLSGSLAGTGGIVGAWVLDAGYRKRVSAYNNVVMKDLEEMPSFLVLSLWLFAIFTITMLFAADFTANFLAILLGTIAGGLIHFVLISRQGKLKS